MAGKSKYTAKKDSTESRSTALYVRVSTDAQFEEGYSAEAQSEMLVAYCVSRRIDKYELYVDGGWSGSSLERPEMKRLISDVREGKINTVVVYKLDRLSRSQKDTLYLIEDVFNPYGADFVSLNENMDTSTPIGRAMLGIMSAFAQLERETIRERTRMGMKERVKRGLWPGGGKIPFGYDYDSESGLLVPNGDADTVRLMYELYLKGWSMMRIARTLGLKYEKLVQQILKRKTNIGIIPYNGEEYRGLHKPIVSEDVYYEAMDLMKERERGEVSGTGTSHLLAGLVVCGVCGAKMRYQKWGKRGYKLYCYSQDKGKPHLAPNGPCENTKTWAEEIEEIVISDLFRFAVEDKAGNKPEDTASELYIKQLEKQTENLTRKIKALYELYAESEDRLLLETINEKKSELEEANEKLKNEVRRGAISKKVKKDRERLKNIESAWKYLDFDSKRRIIQSCVEKIKVTFDRVDIYYKSAFTPDLDC